MSVLVRASFSYLVKHPLQLALAVLGVAVGVAVIVAVDLANSSSRKAFLLSMDTVTGEATHQLIGGPQGVAETDYAALRLAGGIRYLAPLVTGSAKVNGRHIQLLGIDLFAEQEMRARTGLGRLPPVPGTSHDALIRKFLTEPDSVLLAESTAQELGLAVGDTIMLRAAGRDYTAILIALIPTTDGSAPEDLLLTDIANAQAWLDQRGWLTRVDVKIDNPQQLRELTDSLPQGIQLLSAAGRTRTTADLSAAFMTNLTAMSLLALLVGLFLIFNSISFSVLQRRSLIGTLRALGVTPRQIFALLVIEAALLGLIAATIGVLAGIVLGDQLLELVSRSINDLYYRISVQQVSVSHASIVKGLLAGVATAVVASMLPALEAMRYPPRQLMQRSSLEARAHNIVPRLCIAGTVVILFAYLLLQVSGRELVPGLVALFLVVLGSALCLPLLVLWASRWLAPLTKRSFGLAAGIAVADVGQRLSRTGIAIVALAVAVSATVGVSIMVSSFRASVSSWLNQTLQADVYVSADSGSLDRSLLPELMRIDGIVAYSTNRRVRLEGAGRRTRLLVIDMPESSYAGTELLDAHAAEVWPDWEHEDAVLVSEQYAYRNPVTRGDSVELQTDTGSQEFEVLSRYQSYDVNASTVLMSRATYQRHFADRRIDGLGYYLADGVTTQQVRDEIHHVAEDRQLLRVNSNENIRRFSLEIFDRTFIITDVLYWLALGVAVVGTLSALLAMQLEQSRETALLRALGMTPLEVGGMLAVRSGTIGLFSGLASLPLGILMAVLLLDVINRRAYGWEIEMLVSPGALLVALVLAIGAALLGAIYPAIIACRQAPAVAMRTE